MEKGEGGMGRFWVCERKVVSVFLTWRLLWQCTVTARNDHTRLLLEERSTIVDLPGDHAWRMEGLTVSTLDTTISTIELVLYTPSHQHVRLELLVTSVPVKQIL